MDMSGLSVVLRRGVRAEQRRARCVQVLRVLFGKQTIILAESNEIPGTPVTT